MRRLIAALAASAALVVGALPVAASHTHVRSLPGGSCVILAATGHEEDVALPEAVFASNPNVDPAVAYPAGRRHPLHVLVHIADKGARDLFVLGSAAATAACQRYVND